MRAFLVVFVKEIVDNFRDRRSLTVTLLMALMMPVLFVFLISMQIERFLDDEERSILLPVIGAGHAPNLMRYLESRNIEIVEAPPTRPRRSEAVEARQRERGALIPDNFGAHSPTFPATVN